MNRLTILLVFGGQSSEHDISILSARNVFDALDNEKYDVRLGYIDQQGKWWLVDTILDSTIPHNGEQLLVVPGEKKLFTIDTNTELSIDVILPILHGKNGEDGTIQGMAAMLNVACAGPSLLGAALTMDKDLTKNLLHQASVPVSGWIPWRTSEKAPDYSLLADMFDGTFFVKPARAGSSYGVSKVTSEQDYEAALILAAKYDSKVMIESFVKAIEVQVSVYGKDDPVVSEICEIDSSEEYHDFNDKYSDQSSVKFHIPARLSTEQTERIKNYALTAYKATECLGMARIDFFVVDENTEYVNEINSIPGFTAKSVFPKLWQHQGLTTTQILDRLIELALE